jgi:hypothetical protein
MNQIIRPALHRMLSNSIIHGCRTLREPLDSEKYNFGSKLDLNQNVRLRSNN